MWVVRVGSLDCAVKGLETAFEVVAKVIELFLGIGVFISGLPPLQSLVPPRNRNNQQQK